MLNAEALCKRFDTLKSGRGTWESQWQEIAEYVFPRKAEFNVTRTTGDKRGTKIFDGTGIYANEMLAAGLHGMATNPASRWFSLKMEDEKLSQNDAVKDWLSNVEDLMFAKMHSPRSAVTSSLHELYLDYGSFGTGVMFIGENEKDILFQTRFLGECVLDTNANGKVDTVIRAFTMTVRQCVQKWGDDCSEEIRKKHADGKLDESVDLLHAVYPRSDADPDMEDDKNFPFASVYLEKKDKHKLTEGGFEEFPFAAARWSVASGEIYGRSPAMTALADIKMLQEMMKTTIKAAQKIVDPPLAVPDDGLVGPLRTYPGGLNFIRGEYEIRPIVTNGNIPLSLEMMQDLRNRIMSVFFVDQLQMAGDADMTATEVMQRTEERMRLLGPILGRMQSELLGPIISRVFGIMSRNGNLPPQPEELDGHEWVVEYVSPIALAQRGQKVQRALNMLQAAGQVAAFAPEVMARFDGANFMPWVSNEMGVDPDIVLDDAEFEAKQQQQQAAQMIEPMGAAADAYAKMGQGTRALADADAAGRT